ncbi:transcription termination/antitermination protein NusG [Bacteroides heparinolyticus]|uniref:transcription termination/antitermination protein NusG n=1 Tax=Prevotella heparinolytica TaxID=28113 RepID=UPI0035A15D74
MIFLSNQAQWYVVHTYSGHENKVMATIDKARKNRGMEDIIQKVMVPMEEVVEVKDGKEKVKQRKIFPGYCLVKMIVTDESWYVVRNTKGVTGFVGPNSKPVPLTQEEVDNMGLEKEMRQVYSFGVEVGDKVEILTGAFMEFVGTVTEIEPKEGIAKVQIFMFGDRETILDLEISQIKKVD